MPGIALWFNRQQAISEEQAGLPIIGIHTGSMAIFPNAKDQRYGKTGSLTNIRSVRPAQHNEGICQAGLRTRKAAVDASQAVQNWHFY
jgi:hypothetical protein